MADDSCGQCSHIFDAHFVLRTGDEVTDGGLIICDEDGCPCLATWAPDGHEPWASAEDQLRAMFELPDGPFDVVEVLDELRQHAHDDQAG